MTEKIISLIDERYKRSDAKVIADLVIEDLTELAKQGIMIPSLTSLHLSYKDALNLCLYIRREMEAQNIEP
jgi:metallophosphoesterase superfamily enzyme